MVDTVLADGGRRWLTFRIALVAGLLVLVAVAGWRPVLRCQVSIRCNSTLVSMLDSLYAWCMMVDTMRGDGGGHGLTCGVVLVAGLVRS